MAIKKNTVKVDLCSYPPYMILGERKIGKTTLMPDLAKEAFGDSDKLLLVSMGEEEGYHHIDGLPYEVAPKWTKMEDSEGNRGFVEIVDDIVKNNLEYGFKMVALDTFDEMVRICSEEVMRLSFIETKKQCKSLNDAFGGYNRGVERLKSMLLEQITRLHKSGLAVFILAHTKMKEKTDPLTGEQFEVLTNDLRADIYGFIADKCQMITVIAKERNIAEGRLVGEKRMMFFRDNGLIEAGGRFYGLPEKLELNAKNFMEAFKLGVKNSMASQKTDEELKKQKHEEEKINNEKAQNFVREELQKESNNEIKIDKQDLLNQIISKFKNASSEEKENVKNILNGTKLVDANIEILQKILNEAFNN